MKTLLRNLAAAAVLTLSSLVGFAAEVGDDAPELTINEWVQGDPVEVAAGDNHFVIVFWATYNGPSVKVLTEMEEQVEKHKGKNVVFVGMSVEKPASVKGWLDGREKKPSFAIGTDKYQNTYGEYIGEKGDVPRVFIVHKSGKLIWSQGAGDRMEKLLDKLASGKFDMDAVLRKQEAVEAMKEAAESKDFAKAKDAAKTVVLMDPEDAYGRKMLEWLCRRDKDPETWRETMAKAVERIEGNELLLNAIAWDFATATDLNWRDLGTALVAVRKSLAAGEKDNASVIDTYARVAYELGDLDFAVKEQRRAVKVHEATEVEVDAKEQHKTAGDGLKSTLAYYERCQGARKFLKKK